MTAFHAYVPLVPRLTAQNVKSERKRKHFVAEKVNKMTAFHA